MVWFKSLFLSIRENLCVSRVRMFITAYSQCGVFPTCKECVHKRSTCQLTETRMQRSCKCYLCEEEDGNVPVSILDSHITQWKLLLSRKMHISIVFADIFACYTESLGSAGLWRKGLTFRDYRIRSASFSTADTMA